MISSAEKTLLKAIIGFLVPVTLFLVTLFLVAVVNFYCFQSESIYLLTLPLLALAGGIGLDVFYAEKWTRGAYGFRLKWLAALLVFYAVGMFGAFMGVPVFHVLFAIPAGLYIGRRLRHECSDEKRKAFLIRRTCWFTTGLMTGICLMSAFIALWDRYTAANLQGMLENMFGIHFITVTPGFIVGLILIGGTGLVAVEYYLTKTAIRWAYRRA